MDQKQQEEEEVMNKKKADDKEAHKRRIRPLAIDRYEELGGGSSQRRSSARRNIVYDPRLKMAYVSNFCRDFWETGYCPYGDKCPSFHGFQFDYVFDWTILKYQQSQIAAPPTRGLGIGAGPSSGTPPVIPNGDRPGEESGKQTGLSSLDASRRRNSAQITNSGNLAKEKSSVANDATISTDAMMSSSGFGGRASGSMRRGNNVDPTGRSRIDETRQRSSPQAGSSDPRNRTVTATKKYETTLKGMESLNFEDEERIR